MKTGSPPDGGGVGLLMADRGTMRGYDLLVRWPSSAEIALNGGIVNLVCHDCFTMATTRLSCVL